MKEKTTGFFSQFQQLAETFRMKYGKKQEGLRPPLADKHILERLQKAFEKIISVDFPKIKTRKAAGAAVGIALVMTFVASFPPSGSTPALPGKVMDEEIEIAGIQEQEEGISQEVYAIQVNQADILYLASEEDANAVLNGVIARYATPGAQITDNGFAEDVEIVKREMDTPAVVFSVEDGITYIITGTTEPKTYTVKGGDNLWDIAIVNGISPYQLQEMNPGLDPKRLSIGQELYLYETRPFMTVHFTEMITQQERIAYNTTYEDTDSLYKGQTQVKMAGAYGSKETVSEVVKENGIIVASTVLSETILQEPVTQVALKGTKSIPVYTGSGSGSLMSPMGHIEISSAFGSRGSGRHAGVDFRNPKGTPISAAADGVVTFSAYSGSYGNLVKISHGGGLETYYAHCDELYVAVGETISKGQIIGTVGITGNASGYHLHFEVRLNGVAQNPMNYI